VITNRICLIGVGIHLPNSIVKSPTLDQMEKNHIKPMISTMNHDESFNENNVLLSDENKVMNNIISYYIIY